MNMKASLKYQLIDYKKPVMIFYFVIFCVISLFYVGAVITIKGNSSDYTKIGGLEMTTVIFLFVAGLNSFKDTFRMLLQNGVSRKTVFVGNIVTAAIVSFGMAIIDYIILLVGKQISLGNDRLFIEGMFEQLYPARVGVDSMLIESLLLNFFLYTSAIAIGYFITILYYRMSKAAKTIVSIGVPVGVFFLMPIIDSTITNGKIMYTIREILDFSFGITKSSPIHAVVTLFLTFILFSALSWLFMRKAVEKNN